MSDRLAPQHLALIEASGIDATVASERGYLTISVRADLKRRGFSTAQIITPTLLIPVFAPNGSIATYQSRPDSPRVVQGKAVKYETVAGSTLTVDVHPRIRGTIKDPSVPLYVTEGIRKADAAISRGLCCVALLGVWNWKGKNEFGGTAALAAWDEIALAERDVYIAYDSDALTKEQVGLALVRLKAFLESRKARVHIIQLISSPDGSKVGLDDFFAKGGTVHELQHLVKHDWIPPTGEKDATGPYYCDESGTYFLKNSGQGVQSKLLANFSATIESEILEDDGVERRRFFSLRAKIGAREYTFAVPSEAFAGMGWALEHLGARAILSPGQCTKDSMRAAIQMLSTEPPCRRRYTHTGWVDVGDGNWSYLHAAGSLGSDLGEGVEVCQSGVTANYVLPEPPVADARIDAVRGSLRLIEEGPKKVMVPLLAAVVRSVLGDTDFSIHISGKTGAFKSEVAALAQQHFGARMNRRNLPANWSSTDNALEALAFLVKDAPLVIDDFIPKGGKNDVQRLHQKADRVLRGQGNQAGRQRMLADGRMRATRPPRGLIISTGEDVPAGQSLKSRIIDIAVGDRALSKELLSTFQADAAVGLYASCMSAYITWLAPQLDTARAWLSDRIAHLREEMYAGSVHLRTPEALASLLGGLEVFMRFATEIGAISAAHAETILAESRSVLRDLGRDQADEQSAGDPAVRFLELVASALSSGLAHAASVSGQAPNDPHKWGWRENQAADGTFMRPAGERIGWLSGDELYLDGDCSYRIAVKAAADSADCLSITPRSLHKRLKEAGMLRRTEESRQTNTVRIRIEGANRKVLCLYADSVFGDSTDKPDKPDSAASIHDRDRQVSLSGPARFDIEPDPGIRPPSGIRDSRMAGTEPDCQDCQVGQVYCEGDQERLVL